MATNDPTLKIKKFLGLNTMARDEELKLGELRKAENLDVTDSLRLRRRPGYTEIDAGRYHSLWSCPVGAFVVSGGTLYEVDDAGATTVIRTGLTQDAPMTYEMVNSMVFYSNGKELGKIVEGTHFDWGVEEPEGAFDLSSGGGAMRPGLYQVRITYVNSFGEESAASDAQTVTISAIGSLSLSSIPQPVSSEVTRIRVYATHADDSVFFRVNEIPVGVSNLTITGENYTGELKTEFLSAPPPCSIIRYYNGQLYLAVGGVIWHTDPLSYSLVRKAKNFFMYPEDITVMEVVDAGIFVVADRTYFLEGKTASGMSQDVALNATGVRGTGMVIDAQDFGKGDPLGDVAIWMSSKGVVAGMSDGSVQLLTERKVAFPVADQGAMALIKRDGIAQLLSTLEEPNDDRENFSMGDRVTAEVRRNGVVI
jgi:hypothetical protein